MDQKVKIKKQNKIESFENLDNHSKEELIDKIKALSAHNLQLKNLLAKKITEQKIIKNTKQFDFSKYQLQHVALHLLYLGWDYKGFVVQEDTTDTVEHHLFEALTKTKLIKDRSSSNYHRCGRTDKGVSSFGQVISLDLRTNVLKVSPGEDNSNIQSKEVKEPLNYCKILNKVLPSNIQCIGWSPVDETFSARFDCKSRTYKYYFPSGKLNIETMKIASRKLLGTHDFRNLCKMDVGNGVVEFTRNILDINIQPTYKEESEYDIYVITIQAKAFLWHQIRCIMGLLLIIGQEKEKPDVIDELLDIEKYPRKPDYSMGSEIPLNLHYCEYDHLNWQYDTEVLKQIIEQLHNDWTFHAIKSEMIKEMVKTLEEIKNKQNLERCNHHCLSENLMQSFKTKNYIPLLQRPTCDSLEDKIKHYTKRKRIEIVEDHKKQ